MAKRYSLVAYLEILTPAGEPDTESWDTLSRRIDRVLTEAEGLPEYERSALRLGNQIVLVQPVEIELNLPNPIGLPFLLLLELAGLQAVFCGEEVFFRGAVAHGNVRVHGDAIVGPGVRAAQEQARQERVPRIVAAPGLLQAIAEDPLLRRHDLPEELRYMKDLLTEDSDGLWFVNYVAAMEEEIDEPDEYHDWLDEHARRIERVLARAHARGEDARGWLWLATQHDRVVDGLEGIDQRTRASLRVNSDTPLRFRF